jgi:hypothetical protein
MMKNPTIIDVPPARIPELVPLAQQFYAEGDLPGTLDPDVFCQRWAHFLFHGQAILLAAEVDGRLVGSIGAVLTADERDGRLVAHERHWYVTREHRRGPAGIDLFHAFQREARRKGAVRLSMAHLANGLGEKLKPLFLREGFQPAEVHYMRDIEQPGYEVSVIDGFLDHSLEARQRALNLDFKNADWAGKTYRGVAECSALDVDIIQKIEQETGKRCDMKLSFFRSGRQGIDAPTTYIHADNAVPARFAGVLYLTPDHLCRGGTAFWRHKSLFWDRLPPAVPPELADRLNQDGQDEQQWDQTRMVQMKFNRFVMYPTDVFHSRYPKEGFGQTLEDGRLVYVCFFDLQED